MAKNKAEEEGVWVWLDDGRSRFWVNFWNIFWVLIAIWFVYYAFIAPPVDIATPEEIESFYAEDDIPYLDEDLPLFQETKVASQSDVLISYNINDDCSDYMSKRIRKAFRILTEETDSLLYFTEIGIGGDLEISCSIPKDRNDYDLGVADLGTIGYLVKGSTIDFYDIESREEEMSEGLCRRYPDVEIHEILHTFGFDHSTNRESIMAEQSEWGCDVESIDDYIIECLKYTYTNGVEGTDCSDRIDVASEIEYLNCEDGWYDAINSEDSCCPDPGMYIGTDGYCV